MRGVLSKLRLSYMGMPGKRADLDDLFMPSAVHANFYRYLRWLKDKGEIDDFAWRRDTFEFPARRGASSYAPDFWVKDGGREYYLTIKAKLSHRLEAQLQRMARHHEDTKLVVITAPEYRKIAGVMRSLIKEWE